MKLCVWDLEAAKKTSEVVAHGGDVVSISLSPDGNQFVTGSVDRTCKRIESELILCYPRNLFNASGKLWDVRDCKQIQTFFGHSADVNRFE